MSTDTNNLPDLPEPDHLLDGGTVPFFTAEQMRAYAQATADAWAQTRDAAAMAQPAVPQGEPIGSGTVVADWLGLRNDQRVRVCWDGPPLALDDKVYAHPFLQPPREPLSDEQIEAYWFDSDLQPQILGWVDVFCEGARFAERAHGITAAQEQKP